MNRGKHRGATNGNTVSLQSTSEYESERGAEGLGPPGDAATRRVCARRLRAIAYRSRMILQTTCKIPNTQ
eukprot:4945219-Pleurochrysis_carterae.AAC.1